jgi:crotonyl-CoA carboxylase/reductase
VKSIGFHQMILRYPLRKFAKSNITGITNPKTYGNEIIFCHVYDLVYALLQYFSWEYASRRPFIHRKSDVSKDLYPIGSPPPLGEVPTWMHACTVRQERFGPPLQSLRYEVVAVPEVGDDEVLVYVMAAGINYNTLWAGKGLPIDVIAARQKAGEVQDFHIGGSDASGVVYRVGKNVRYPRVGDEVVVHCGMWDGRCPSVQAGQDPMFSPSFSIWGYDRNWGSFAQFAKVQAHQCLPRPQHLSWEASAAYMLVGATAYRMLYGFAPNRLQPGMPVLVWGGAGGLGSMAIQICRAAGALPVAVVSDSGKFDYCMQLGAVGCINRSDFDHWGMLPHWTDKPAYQGWLRGARAFGEAIWNILGERASPAIVFEHPGEATLPTSVFVCAPGGMVVTCAGTSGYNATIDLRYLWTRQKRFQGSHFANDDQAEGFNRLVEQGKVDPCLSRTFRFDEIPMAHHLMYENTHPHGNMAVLVGAKVRGQGRHRRVEHGELLPA